jgi:transcriptional regulator with XRE-family HTH domain
MMNAKKSYLESQARCALVDNRTYLDNADNVRMETIGQRIKRLREQSGLSQRALAKLCGCSSPAISDVENGHSATPSAKVLIKMCEVFSKSQRYILFGEDGDVTIPSKDDQILLEKLASLSPTQRQLVLGTIDALLNK